MEMRIYIKKGHNPNSKGRSFPKGPDDRRYKAHSRETRIRVGQLLSQLYLSRSASKSWEEAPEAEKRRRVFAEQNQCCLHCGIGKEWQGKPLVLEIDHINGMHEDWRRENLRGLCPNCHSQTPTYRSKNARRIGGTADTHGLDPCAITSMGVQISHPAPTLA